MLTILFFGIFAALFGFLWKFSNSYSLQKELSQKKPSGGWDFMVCCLAASAIPWFFLTYGAAVQFYIGSRCPNLLRDPDPGGWLMVVSVSAFALSYIAVYKAGHMAGYREGEWQEKCRFPHFVREDPSGIPTEIRGWVRHDSTASVGDEWFYEKRIYKIASVVEKDHQFKFIVAIHEPKQEEFNSRI